VANRNYHRRQADIFTRLSEMSRNADSAAAFSWLATEHRARAELSESLAQQQQQIQPKKAEPQNREVEGR
jgi:hypothetical protein